MDNEEYRKKIASEYNRLFNRENDKEDYIHLIMYGNEGLESYFVTQDISELGVVNRMELRARFNGHRNLHVYGFVAEDKVPEEMITKEFLENPKIVRLY